MRIFIGLTDVANITFTYAKGFKALGHQVYSAVWNRSYFYPDSEYDFIIDEREPNTEDANPFHSYLRMIYQATRLMTSLKCDLFLLYAPAVLPTHLYYPFLKRMGKKIISAYWGSDIRYWYAFREEMSSLGMYEEMAPFFDYAKNRSGGSYWDKLRTIRVAEKYSDLIISQPDCAQLQSRPYMRSYLPLDLSLYEFNVPARTSPLILHAPSIPEAKGTDVVLRCIQELREEGLDFEFRLIEKMPNAQLRKLLTQSDIVIDELYSATVAGLSAEAMATGNAVLVRYMNDYSKVPAGCPSINTNCFTLKNNLREVILNVNYRRKQADRGRPYVEIANDHNKICSELLNWVESKDHLEYDFHPTFYQELRIPSEILQYESRQAKSRRCEFFRALLSTGTTKLERNLTD